jgi:hypothetical protein
LEYGEYPEDATAFAESKYYDAAAMQGTYMSDRCYGYSALSGGTSYELYCTSEDQGSLVGAPAISDEVLALKFKIVLRRGEGILVEDL